MEQKGVKRVGRRRGARRGEERKGKEGVGLGWVSSMACAAGGGAFSMRTQPSGLASHGAGFYLSKEGVPTQDK